MKNIIYIGLLTFFASGPMLAQPVFEVDVEQNPPLQLHMGSDFEACVGTKVELGQNIVLQNVVGNVYYSWTNEKTMDNSTAANPKVYVSKSTKYKVTITDSRGCQVMGEVTIETNLCDDLIKGNSSDINVFPNPASDFVSVDWRSAVAKGPVHIRIIDAIGRPVKEKYLSDAREGQHTFHLGNRLNGFYYLQLVSDGRTFTRKFQIQ